MSNSSGSSRPPCRQPVIITLSVTEAHPQSETEVTKHKIKQTRGSAKSQEEEEDEEEGSQAWMSDKDRKPRRSWDIKAPRILIVTDKHELTTPTAYRHISTQWQQLVCWKKGWLKQRALEIYISRNWAHTQPINNIDPKLLAEEHPEEVCLSVQTHTHAVERQRWCILIQSAVSYRAHFHKHTPTLLIYDRMGLKRGQ